MLTQRTIIITLTGTIGGRTILLNPTRIITGAPRTTGIAGIEVTTATIAIVIITAIRVPEILRPLTSRSDSRFR
jgi:hypothetical protein